MALLFVPRGPVIGLEANTLQPTVSQLGTVPMPSFSARACERAPFDFWSNPFKIFSMGSWKLPFRNMSGMLVPGNWYYVPVLTVAIMTNILIILSNKWIQSKILMWTMVKTANLITFASSVRLSVFRAGTLSYSCVQVQSPIRSRHLRNIYILLDGWIKQQIGLLDLQNMLQTNRWFTVWKPILYSIFSVSCGETWNACPFRREEEIFTLGSPVHGSKSALWMWSDSCYFRMLICIHMWSIPL